MDGFNLSYESITSNELKARLLELRDTDPERYLKLTKASVLPEGELEPTTFELDQEPPTSATDNLEFEDDADDGEELEDIQALGLDPKPVIIKATKKKGERVFLLHSRMKN
jgi:hypothetical protein